MTASVVLIQPPESQRRFTRRGTLLPPLGLASVASALRQSGSRVRILDCEGQGLSWIDLTRDLERMKPDIVGITSTSFTMQQVARTARVAKETGAFVVVGGPHASLQPQSLLEAHVHVDAVVQNEGEITMTELVDRVERGADLGGVPGVAFRKDGRIVLNEPRTPIADLDTLPFPAWDIIPPGAWKNYWDPRCNAHPVVTLQTNRGCPYNCAFCSEFVIYGKGVRFRSAPKIVDEMEYCIERFGAKGVSIVDSIFTLRPALVEAVCDEIISRNLDVSWFCNSRVDSLRDGMLPKMKKAGCIRIYFGVETGTTDGLIQVNKKATLGQAVEALSACKRHGVRSEAGFIMGLPRQTRKDMLATVEFAKRLNADSTQFSILLPLPGTAVFDSMVEMGINIPDADGGFNLPNVSLCDLSCQELREMQKLAYRAVYLRPEYVLGQLRKIGRRTIKNDAARLAGFVRHMIG